MNIVFDNIIPLPRTRFRRSDPATSKAAAAYAFCGTTHALRRRIRDALDIAGPKTAREIAVALGADFVAVSRRMSEIPGIERTGEVRDGCAVWRMSPGEPCYLVEQAERARETLG